MDIAHETYDYRALWDRLRRRTWKLIKITEATRDELAATRDELAETRRQRDMLARRLAELTHIHHGVRFPQQAA